MKLFLTGATGYVGQHCLYYFLERGHQVYALTRSDQDFAHDDLNWINGSLEDPTSYREYLAEADVILHLAMEYGSDTGRRDIDRVAVETFIESGTYTLYTGNLYTSHQPGMIIKEESLPDGHYWWNDHESLILAADTPSAVIRLGFVYGGSGCYLWPGLSANDEGNIPYCGSQIHHWPFVHVNDVVRLYEMILTKQAEGIFHAVDDQPVIIGEVLKKVSELQGGTPFRVPHGTAKERLGGFADHMLKNILVTKERSEMIGWKPEHDSFIKSAEVAYKNYLQANTKEHV
ncbi:NAD-dependent epimerase/dehydratase family protein [Balneola sp. MJW-20]|uniref:NAD-dependent epimerase/dehydratase family protein n=1 Tax=Gracilimonas aurantiaca TaxID=3234185 RepID=UPI0034659059